MTFFNKARHNIVSTLFQTAIALLFLSLLIMPIFSWQLPILERRLLLLLAITLTVVQCLRLKTFILLVDRIFATKPGKQIMLALFVFIIAFDVAFCMFPKADFRCTFIDFISPSKLLSDTETVVNPNPKQPFTISPDNKEQQKQLISRSISNKEYFKHGLVYFMGLIIFNGLLIATINRFMATRAERYKQGANTYGSITDHYVVIGYGVACASIIRNVANRHKDNSPPYFILISNQNIDTISRNIQTQLNDIKDRIIIYSGDMDSRSHLNRLNIGKAREVFILGESREPGRDSKNLECARSIKEIREASRNDAVLHVNVQFDKPVSYSTIKRITIPQHYYKGTEKEVIYIRPFNFYENWARLLFGNYQLDCYQPLDRGLLMQEDTDHRMVPVDKHVHLVIAGFNEMGVALLLEALRVCHYPNYDEISGKNKTVITVVDPQLNQMLPRFQSQYQYLSQIKDVEVRLLNNKIEDNEVRDMLEKEAQDDDVLLTVSICFHDSDDSLSAALCLPDALYYHLDKGTIKPNETTQILVQQELKSGLADLLDEENGKYSNVKIFGTLDQGVDDKLLNDKMAVIIAAYYHFMYDLNPSRDFFQAMKENRQEAMEEANRNWMFLSEDKRFANRYQTELYKSYRSYRPLLEQRPELLYQTEHLRWCAERSIAGYRDMHEQNLKDPEYKLHNQIVPYHDLSEKEKVKDRNVLHVMDQVIELSERPDFEIV